MRPLSCPSISHTRRSRQRPAGLLPCRGLDPGTRECERVDTEPIGVGARWHNVSEFRGRRTELDYELVRCEPARLTCVGRNKTATSTDDVTFEPTDEGTGITYRSHVRFHGLARLADPFLRREFVRLGDELEQTLPRAVTAHHDREDPGTGD